MIVDKLNRLINIGDIIAVGDYSNTVSIAKVTKITNKTVVFKTYSDWKIGRDASGALVPLEAIDLLNEPTSYSGWTYHARAAYRLLILRKANKKQKITNP